MAEVLLRITTGFWASKALFAAAELGVADAIHQHGGPATAEEITTALSGSDPRAMFRVLRFLASMGVFDMQLEGSPDDIAYHKTYRFSLNATSQLLRSDVENSMRASVRLEAGPLHYGVWANFLDAAKTGRSVTKAVLGTEMWDYYESHPQEQAIFNAAMTNITAKEVADVLSGYDFAGVTSLVDIGGGLGSLLFGILRRYPTIKKGHLFDLPSVVKNVVVPEDLVDRVEVHGGSFLDGDAAGIPAGADAYIMKHIIHDWDDEHSERILQATRKAMPAHAKVLLAEYGVPIGPEPCLAKALDLHMMTLLSAKERTRAEFAALFRSVGLELTRVTGVEGGINVVEAHLA